MTVVGHLAQLVKCLLSGHDPKTLGSSPASDSLLSGESLLPLAPSAAPPAYALLCSLSNKNLYIKKKPLYLINAVML